MEVAMMLFGGIALILAVLLYDSLCWGFVLYKFSGWFLAPVFTDFPQITFWQAVGLSIVLSLCRKHTVAKLSYKTVEVKQEVNWAAVILAPWLTLFTGWFMSLFI